MLRLIIGTILLVQVILGVLYGVYAFPHLSTYGDTEQYLSLSESLQVPDYRGILYPAILFVLQEIFSGKVVPSTYLLQCLVAITAIWYFLSTFISQEIVRQSTSIKSLRYLMWFGLLTGIVFDPLYWHFNLVILTDSLTTSMVLIFIASLTRSLQSKKRNVISVNALATATSFITMSLLRPEKIYIAGSTLICICFFCIWREFGKPRHQHSQQKLRLARTVAIVFLVGITAVTTVNRLSPNIESQYAPVHDIRLLVANRLTYKVFGKIYGSLTEESRKIISRSDALWIDEHRRNLNIVMKRVFAENNEKYNFLLLDVITTTIKKEFITSVKNFIDDLICYLFPPIAFHLQYWFGENNFSRWTVSNMIRQTQLSGLKPVVIVAYLYISAISHILAFLTLSWFIVSNPRIKSIAFRYCKIFVIGLLFHLLNSLFFGLLSVNFHIRYALPSLVILLNMIYICLFIAFSESNKTMRNKTY